MIKLIKKLEKKLSSENEKNGHRDIKRFEPPQKSIVLNWTSVLASYQVDLPLSQCSPDTGDISTSRLNKAVTHHRVPLPFRVLFLWNISQLCFPLTLVHHRHFKSPFLSLLYFLHVCLFVWFSTHQELNSSIHVSLTCKKADDIPCLRKECKRSKGIFPSLSFSVSTLEWYKIITFPVGRVVQMLVVGPDVN